MLSQRVIRSETTMPSQRVKSIKTTNASKRVIRGKTTIPKKRVKVIDNSLSPLGRNNQEYRTSH